MSDYQQHGQYLHNNYRKHHGSPKLELNDRLNKAADAYAYKLASWGTLQHTSGLDYNENLYMSTDTRLSKSKHVEEACRLWYEEKRYYNYNYGGFSMQTGHFTAMVWKESTLLGIGCGSVSGRVVVVACYKCCANMMGAFRDNVLPYREVEESDDEEDEEEELDEESLRNKLCTFTTTQKKYVKQHWYECKTCKMSDGEGACTICAKVCHKDHDVTYAKYGPFFCDCGAKGEGNCIALTKRTSNTETKTSVLKEEKKHEEDEKFDVKLPSPVKEYFSSKADSKLTIGWPELADILNNYMEIDFKFDGFDKIICRLMVSMITFRSGEKSRIGVDVLENIWLSVVTFINNYRLHDKDRSGTLDPFELKEALEDAGFKLNYKTFQVIQKQFGTDDGFMDFRHFMLCFQLLAKLQAVQEMKSDTGMFEDFSLKDLLQEQLDMASN